MARAYVAVEGHGEVRAVPNLLNRLCVERGYDDVVWAPPYKPAVDQLALTRLVDFRVVRKRGLQWFGTLERTLAFLYENRGRGPGLVYPRSS